MLTDKQIFARHCAYEEAIEHCRSAAGADRDFLEPHESEELLALADRLDKECTRIFSQPRFLAALKRMSEIPKRKSK